mgnify:FL=1
MSRICSSTLNNQRNIKSGLSENCSEMTPTIRGGEKRKGGMMTDKKDVVIWGYESKVCNGKKDIIKKYKLSDIIRTLNFITEHDENFPHTYYINKKDIAKD